MPSELKTIVRSFTGTVGTLGGSLDHAALRHALACALKHQRGMLWLAASMVLVIVVIEVVVRLVYLSQPVVLAGIGGAMGLTSAGAIETVRRIARDMAQTNLLMALASELDGETLKPIISALARKL